MNGNNEHRVGTAFVQRRYAWPNAERPDHLVVDELLPDGSFNEMLIECSDGLCSGESIEVEHLLTRTPDNDHELVVLHTPTHDWSAEVLAEKDGAHIEERVIESLAGLLTPRVEPIPNED